MKIEIKQNFKEFKTVWEQTISKICIENELLFTKEGLEIKFICPSNALMGRFRLTADAFETYEVEEEESIYIKTDNFVKYLKSFKKEVVLESINNELIMSDGKKKYNMRILSDVDKKRFKSPDEFERNNYCIINVEEMIEVIKNNKLIDEIVILTLTQEGLSSSSLGSNDSFESKIELIDKKLVDEIMKVNIKVMYLEQILNNAFETITFNCKTNEPLIFRAEKENMIFDGAVASFI